MKVVDLTKSQTASERMFSAAVGITQSTLVKLGVALKARRDRDTFQKWINRAELFAPRLAELGLVTERLWWGPMTLHVRNAEFLLDEIERVRPKQVLEVGAGTSTAVLAAAADHYGFKLTTLENYPGTISYVNYLIGDLACSNAVTVQKCGFRKFRRKNGVAYKWYNADLSQINNGIDFVVVDGPMSSMIGRNGAMHQIIPYLNPNSGFYVDDCKRKHEQECVKEWEVDYPGLTAQVQAGLFSITVPEGQFA